MTPVSINGIEFKAEDGEPSDFGYFIDGHPKASDTGPYGMVEEMKAFIALQDKLHLRSLIDVGALFGVFSLVFTRYKDAAAIAIEPSIEAFQGLLKNCVLNPDRTITPVNAFAGETNGKYVTCGIEWKHMIANRPGDSDRRLSFPERPVDLLVEPNTKFDCMKIDVEGFECPVLRGARKTIERCKPAIFLEAHFTVLPEVSGDSNESLYALIKDMKYTPFTFQGQAVESFAGVTWCRYILQPDKL